jgi:hypothetical protein
MDPNDFTIQSAYKREVQFQIKCWCDRHDIRFNVEWDHLDKEAIARLVTLMGRTNEFFKLPGIIKGKWSHKQLVDKRAARIKAGPIGTVADLAEDSPTIHDGMRVSRFRTTYANPNQRRITEDDER